jgi:DNA-binding MurR/RpiR family transcriptional regulator
VHLIDTAVDKRCKVLSISDSLVSPVAKPATQVLQVREAEVHKFRSLSASMCLAQSLVIAYALSMAGRKATK